MQLPSAYLARMRTQLGDSFDDYMAAMRAPAKRALRVNTLKTDPAFLCAHLPFLTPTGLVPEGFFVPDSFMPSREPLHAAGLFYMQEPTAQLPAALPPLGNSETPVVLDLCASPGGKASFLAARMKNSGLLIANEPVPARAETLCRTLERLGVTNAIVTCMKPEPLCAFLAERCDAVLVDAPCSGEGMFRKDARAVLEWSPEHVRACALRQRGILSAALSAVRGGGALVYSTCTFSEAENEEVVNDLIAHEPAFRLERFLRLYPHTSCGEGQCMALLRKRDGGGDRSRAEGGGTRGESCARTESEIGPAGGEAAGRDAFSEASGFRSARGETGARAAGWETAGWDSFSEARGFRRARGETGARAAGWETGTGSEIGPAGGETAGRDAFSEASGFRSARGETGARAAGAQQRGRAAAFVEPESDRCEPFERFCGEYLTEPPRRAVRVLPDGRVLLLPGLMPDGLAALNVRSAGVLAGEVRGGRFAPAHALFLALPATRFRFHVSPDEKALSAYLAGEEIACDKALSGFCAVCAHGHPLGFGKAAGGRLKNHYPKGLRIR